MDFMRSFEEYDEYVQVVRSLRPCAMTDIMACEEFNAPHQLLGLGCGHLYHPECIGGHLKVQIETIRAGKERPAIQCPQCETEKRDSCTCPRCYEENHVHWYSPEELAALVDNEDSPITDQYKDWCEVLITHHRMIMDDTRRFRICPGPNCGEGIDMGLHETYLRCPTCRYEVCVNCNEAHPGRNQTCEQARHIRMKDQYPEAVMRQAFMQACPTCDTPGALPEDCFHITCANCREQYCMVCAAPHRPTLAHANIYHRPACEYFVGGACCEDECVKRGPPGTVCAKERGGTKYDPKNCPECARLGHLCARPVDPTPDDIFVVHAYEPLVAEQKRLDDEKKAREGGAGVKGGGEHK